MNTAERMRFGAGRRRCVSRTRGKRGGYRNGINPANNRPTDFIIGAAGGRRRCVSRSRSTRGKCGGYRRVEPIPLFL